MIWRRTWAVRFTDEQKYFVSEASVYRLLKAHDLITSPAYVVIKAANEFKDKTTAINQLWQTDFTYLKIKGWGWYYLSTVLDDFSRYIVAWKLCATMCADEPQPSTWRSQPRALITSLWRTGQGSSPTMAHLTLQAAWPNGSRTRAWSMYAGRFIIPRRRERSSAGTRPSEPHST